MAKKYELPPDLLATLPDLGEGISRPSPGEKTRLYELLVSIPGEATMRTSVRAATAATAKKYASKRWPTANIIVAK
jgi:hypothetical protein